MQKETVSNINIDTNKLGFSDMGSLSKVIDFLSDNSIKYDVTEISFNNQSGNVYAYIEDTGTTIYSAFNHDVGFFNYTNDDEEDITKEEFLKINRK